MRNDEVSNWFSQFFGQIEENLKTPLKTVNMWKSHQESSWPCSDNVLKLTVSCENFYFQQFFVKYPFSSPRTQDCAKKFKHLSWLRSWSIWNFRFTFPLTQSANSHFYLDPITTTVLKKITNEIAHTSFFIVNLSTLTGTFRSSLNHL